MVLEKLLNFSPILCLQGKFFPFPKEVICSNGCVDVDFEMKKKINYLVILKPTQNLLLCVSSMINKRLMELASTVSF